LYCHTHVGSSFRSVDREVVRARDSLDFENDAILGVDGDQVRAPSALELGLRRSSIDISQVDTKNYFALKDAEGAASLRSAGLLTDKTTPDFTTEAVPNLSGRSLEEDITGVVTAEQQQEQEETVKKAALQFEPIAKTSPAKRQQIVKESGSKGSRGDSLTDNNSLGETGSQGGSAAGDDVPDGPPPPPSSALAVIGGEDHTKAPDAKYLWPNRVRLPLSICFSIGLILFLIIFGAAVDAAVGLTEEFDYINHFHLIAATVTGVIVAAFISLRIWFFPQGSTRGLVFELLFFCAAFIFIQLLIYSRPNASTQSYEMAQSIKSNAFGLTYDNIQSIDAWWNFMFNTFYPFLFPKGNSIADKTPGLFLFGNKAQLYGGFRLRQVRMPPNSCEAESVREMNRAQEFCDAAGLDCKIPTVCYGRYQQDAIDTNPFVSPIDPGVEFPFYDNTYVSTGGKIKKPRDRPSHSSRGEWKYPGSGHTVWFPLHYEDANVKTYDLLQKLRDNQWLDAGTRAVFVEFAFTSHVDMRLAFVSAMVEISPAGFVDPEPVLVQSAFLTRETGVDSDWVTWYYPYLMFQTYMLSEVIIRFIFMGFKPVITSAMTWLEFLNFGVCLAFFALNLIAADYKPSMMQNIPLDPLIDTDNVGVAALPLDGPSYYQTTFMYITAANVLSVVCLLYWTKIIAYLAIFPQLSFLSRIFIKVGGKLLGFFFIFFILVIAFAQAFFMVFSTSLQDFLTTTLACYSMITALTGGLDIKPMFLEQPAYTVVYYVLFVCIMVFTMLTVILAIVHEDGYSRVAEEMRLEDRKAIRRGRTGPFGMLLSGLENYKKLHRADLKRDREAASLPPKNV